MVWCRERIRSNKMETTPELKRWNRDKTRFVTSPSEVDNFLRELIDLCNKHNMSLSHQDSHGAFIVVKQPPNDKRIKWLLDADFSENDNC